MLSLGGAGGHKALIRIADRLVDKGHDVSFVVPLLGFSKIYPTRAKIIRTMPVNNKYKNIEVPYLDFALICAALVPCIPKSDIVCASWCMTALPTHIATKYFRKGIPFYFIQHYESLFFDRFYQSGYRKYVVNSYKYTENIITISKWLDDRIYGITGRRNEIVHPAIDNDVFKPVKREKNEIKTVMCLGVNIKWKGNIDIIRAMEMVYERFPKVKLVIVGRQKLDIDIKIPYEQLQANDEELARLYAKCDVYVLGSWYEGFPAPPLEAMSCGAAVVSTDNLGIREYGIDRQNCMIVPVRDPQAMAEAILAILTDENLSTRLGEEGIKTAQQFSWDKTTDQIEQIFENALMKGKGLVI
jgi:glycosyltransferase involved in cell wall biosynthesis